MPKPTPYPGEDLQEELLRLLDRQVAHAPLTVVISMSIIAYMAYQQAPQLPWLWGTWLGAVVIAQLLRVIIIRNLPARKSLRSREILNTAVLVNVCNTALHSFSLIFFPWFTPFQAALQSMLILGTGVTSIATAMGFLPFALAHICLGLLPLILMWAWSGLLGPGGTLGLIIAGAGAAYSFALYFIARRLFRLFRESFEIRAQLGAALSAAEQADSAKTRFLAAASHDLRQPIHTLSLLSAALGMRQLDEKAADIAQNIDGAVKTLASQLDALLDISKLDAGVVPVNPSRCNLSELLQRLHGELAVAAEQKDIELQFAGSPDAWAVTDPVLLERIVRNLMANAIAHNSHCVIRLSAERREPGNWTISVADTGCGIPSCEQEKIFEEFYQVDNPGRDRDKGLGLGLAIVSRLSRLLELELEFESEPGRGTRFTLVLKADAADEQLEEAAAAPASVENLNVLVVDDEEQVREGMKILLESLGCCVRVACDTSEALALVRKYRPDIALVDFRLRGEDNGLETINRLQQIYPGLPSIIISGDTAPDRLQMAAAAGVPVLNKPVQAEPLKRAIANTCRPAA